MIYTLTSDIIALSLTQFISRGYFTYWTVCQDSPTCTCQCLNVNKRLTLATKHDSSDFANFLQIMW